MASSPPQPTFLSNIGLMLTYRCSIACPHCIVEAGPRRKEEMRLERALDWVDQASDYRGGVVKGLALTGGEPFLSLESLAAVSAHARSRGLIVSVVTNAFWAETRDAALGVLSRVPAIQMISISTDVYHQKSIPFSHIENAVSAARMLGRLYNVAVCTDSEEDPGYRAVLARLSDLIEADKITTAITLPMGRARGRARYFSYRTAPEPTVAACSMAGYPVVFPDGRVVACIGPLITLPPGHPLFLGNLERESLAEIIDRAELNPILHAIRVWGPHKLVSMLKRHGLDALLPTSYIAECVCDPCFKLLSNPGIVEALEQVFHDEQTRRLVAYARLYYLGEARMVELLTAKRESETLL